VISTHPNDGSTDNPEYLYHLDRMIAFRTGSKEKQKKCVVVCGQTADFSIILFA
jgi:hypothetical protein